LFRKKRWVKKIFPEDAMQDDDNRTKLIEKSRTSPRFQKMPIPFERGKREIPGFLKGSKGQEHRKSGILESETIFSGR